MAEQATKLTPETSDVAPLYFAIVSPDDPQAVMDLIALTPATSNTTELAAFKRKDKAWVPDAQIVNDLKSATPPPVVPIDSSILNDILQQVDGLKEIQASALSTLFTSFWSSNPGSAIAAAGGLDRNRGNAEELRQYWTRGKGAAKIRWGTKGDWTRCVRQLSKYMGPRAKGYCQLRHHEVTGMYTGDRRNPGNDFSYADFSQGMVEKSAMSARITDAKERMAIVAGASPVEAQGSGFTIPLVLPENLESGDGRKFDADSVTIRELPLPLMWQIKTGNGHQGSVVVGRIDYMERIEGGIGNATGVFDTGAYGREAERLVRNGFLRGVSADLDQFEAKEVDSENSEDDDNEVEKSKLTINKARVMAVTIVPKPAFQECTIALSSYGTADQEDQMIPEDGIYEETVDAEGELLAVTASGFLSQEIPSTPPSEWFSDPQLGKPTPITVGEDGRIFGHIAAWHVNHIGMPRATKPPRSKSKYAYFHTGVCRTDNGSDVPVGQLTLAGGHAPLDADAASAARHYDDTASAIADVHAGEDAHGIWVAGSLRPNATEGQIRALRASAPSGDWRPINGSLELVAVCQVNVPGFPIARAMVASGKVLALVAAGAHYMAIMKSEPTLKLAEKAAIYAELSMSADSAQLSTRVKKAKRNLKKIKSAQNIESLTASVDSMRHAALVAAAEAEFAKFSDDDRQKLAKRGLALPDGSYPIRNDDDLRNAIQAYGRVKPENKVKLRKHIVKRARALNKAYLIPEGWANEASSSAEALVASMRDKINDLVAAAPKPEKEISDVELDKLRNAKEEADAEAEAEKQLIEDIKDGKPVEGDNVKDGYDDEGRSKYTAETQPRDARGKFRKVLARLKQDLGVAGLQEALKQVETAENMEFAGNYVGASDAADKLINTIDRLDTGALDATKLENVRNTAGELGKVIANLPLPFTNQAQKVRFSDLPPALKNLIDDMISRVEDKIGKKDADIATSELRAFKSGADVYNQSEISSRMATLLRLLT
jgi:hypothetical protein